MKHFIICLLFAIVASTAIHAQDKVVLRNGRTIEVNIKRSLDERIEYTYPGETSVYERPKTAVSYIQYEDGRKEICDESLRQSSSSRSTSSSSRASSSTSRNSSTSRSSSSRSISDDDEIYWQDVKVVSLESDVKGMKRLKRISAVSSTSYKDAIRQLKKKAAAIGATTILVMDDGSDNEDEGDIEVMAIAYRDEDMEYTPRATNERSEAPQESSSNVRRRRIAQQMESYNNESNLEYTDNADSRSSSRNSGSSSRNTSSSRQASSSDAPDAVYLTSGRVIRGNIEEFEPDDFVSIRTSTGKVYEYSMDDVKRVSRGANKRSSSSARSSSRNNDNSYSNNDRQSSRYNNDYEDDSYYDYKESGYKGTFDVGYTLGMGGTGEKGRFELHTSHGYQINKNLFIGAGVGLHMYSARSADLKSSKTNPYYVGSVNSTTGIVTPNYDSVYMHAVDSSYMTLPIFLDVRGYFPLQNSSIVPFAMFRIGYAFNLSDGFGGMGLYLNPAVGIKYQVSPKIGINLSIGYSSQTYGGIPGKTRDGGYGFCYKKNGATYEAKNAGGVNIRIGVEF